MKLVYIAIGALIGYFLFKKLLINNADYKGLMSRGAIIIDARSPQEYDNGHIQGSMNIPLNVVPQNIERLKAKNVPIICVCASGMRSGSASSMLKKAGIESYNGGNWSALNNKI